MWLNFASPFCVCLIMIYAAYIFSGSPFKSKRFEQKLKAVKTAFVIWSLARIIRGFGGMVENQVLKAMFSGADIKTLMLTIVGFFIIEIAPFFYVLDWKFMEIILEAQIADADLNEPLYD